MAASEKVSARLCALYILVTAAAIYSHLYAALILPAQLVAVMTTGNQNRRRIVTAIVIAGSLATPIAWLALTQNIGQNDWIPPLTAKDILHAAQQIIGTGIRFPIGLALLVVAGISSFQKIKHKSGWHDVLLWTWFLIPAIGVVAISAIAPPFVPRYLLLCLPACVMLLAVGLDHLPRPLLVIAATMLLALFYFSSSLSYYRKPKENWRAAAKTIASEMKLSDRILFDREYGRIPMNYYFARSRAETKPQLVSQAELSKLPPSDRVWIVLYGPGHRDPSAIAPTLPIDFRLQQQRDFEAIEILLYAR
jgi:hypothetical protein